MKREMKKLNFKVQSNGKGFNVYQFGTDGECTLVKENLKNMDEVMEYQAEEIGRDLNRRNFLSRIFGKK
jgi:hypothetical protein